MTPRCCSCTPWSCEIDRQGRSGRRKVPVERRWIFRFFCPRNPALYTNGTWSPGGELCNVLGFMKSQVESSSLYKEAVGGGVSALSCSEMRHASVSQSIVGRESDPQAALSLDS